MFVSIITQLGVKDYIFKYKLTIVVQMWFKKKEYEVVWHLIKLIFFFQLCSRNNREILRSNATRACKTRVSLDLIAESRYTASFISRLIQADKEVSRALLQYSKHSPTKEQLAENVSWKSAHISASDFKLFV